MPTKLTLEYVKQYFKDNNCELLENDYINSQTKIRYRCSCGNISKITFDSFKRGSRCKECGIEKYAKKQRLTYEYVQSNFTNEGCELLKEEYKNSYAKMRYRCSCGNISEITFNRFQQGGRCKKCGIKKQTEKHKHTLEFVKQCFKDYDCKLLSKVYINASTLLKYKCNCGNISEITFHNFQKGARCKKCGIIKMSNKMKGKNNPNYNPNLTDEDRVDRRKILGYNIWTKDTYIKDDYTCRKCLVRGGKLNAHHIEGYAKNPDLRLDDDNGITFCVDCHKGFHHTYGYGDNTIRQLEEFLKIN